MKKGRHDSAQHLEICVSWSEHSGPLCQITTTGGTLCANTTAHIVSHCANDVSVAARAHVRRAFTSAGVGAAA
ncbi:hypothetical protein RR46_11141 [Papilio xuthus]|uniref:Uncharacterized protein n=1 Tax=Papilio xuthus TaxID=66420 RepID=A0A194Q3N1_PAPXU|nr:hypothetical protein RR46_11141 [Papilio xuthus]